MGGVFIHVRGDCFVVPQPLVPRLWVEAASKAQGWIKNVEHYRRRSFEMFFFLYEAFVFESKTAVWDYRYASAEALPVSQVGSEPALSHRGGEVGGTCGEQPERAIYRVTHCQWVGLPSLNLWSPSVGQREDYSDWFEDEWMTCVFILFLVPSAIKMLVYFAQETKTN